MGIWSDLVGSAIKESTIPHKTLFIIGGSKEAQNLFIKALPLQNESLLQSVEEVDIANKYELGYSFIQYKNSAKELLSTVEVYTLPARFDQNTLSKIITNIEPADGLVVNLLDYDNEPFEWIRQLWFVTNNFPKFNQLESLQVVINKQRRFDWDQEIHHYIQLALRTFAILYKSSTLYISLDKRSTRVVYLISILLDFPVKDGRINIEPNLVESSELLVPKGVDTWGKIRTISDVLDPEELSRLWDSTDEDNQFTTRYEAIVPRITTDKKAKKTVLEPENVDIPKISYQEFLNDLYDQQQREKRQNIVI